MQLHTDAAKILHIQIDEMESIEHTKLKPLTIPLCVSDTFEILGLNVGKIPAKGHLAELAKIKYGTRENERENVLRELFLSLKNERKITPLSITTDAHPLDPMFALNQRCAKIRSDVRRMTRRSWCTTKKIENLKKHLQLYQIYNNEYALA